MGPNQVAAALCSERWRTLAAEDTDLILGRTRFAIGVPPCDRTRSVMLSVSTTATCSSTAVTHARCDRYFWAFAPVLLLHHDHRVHRAATSVVRLRVAGFLVRCLTRATRSHQETQGSADSVSRCATAAAPSSTGGKRPNRAPRGCAGSKAPRALPLGGSSFHHPLAFSCRRVPTRSLAGTLGHTFWCNLLTWYSEQKSQPLSRQCFTRDAWHRTSPSSSPRSQPGTCLAATVSTTSAPGREATP